MPIRSCLQTVLAQKDQLLETCPGVRLGKPVICGRLSVSPRQTQALDMPPADRSLSFSGGPHSSQGVRTNLLFTMSKQNRRQTTSPPRTFMRMTFYPLNTIPEDWWSRTGSNRRHPACKAGALPAELRPLIPVERKLVGLGGLEPPTSRLSSARSNQLSYKPLSKRG